MAKTIRLMGAHEIRIRLGGVSRQRAYQITSRSDFPTPAADLAQGKVSLTDDVEVWMKAHRRNESDNEEQHGPWPSPHPESPTCTTSPWPVDPQTAHGQHPHPITRHRLGAHGR